MWDDLDLVRYALKSEAQGVYNEYLVVFCDEAQDFTKLEMDLIMNLSKHSLYDLSGNPDDKKIPIAFAGDPNQTINPTGFRWASTKALFTAAFKDSFDNKNWPVLDDKELSKNYRSELGIVKFANTIQALRYKYFDDNTVNKKLQSVREAEKGTPKDSLEYVGFYSYSKYKDIILKNLGNANIITSEEGELGNLSNFPDIKNKNVKLNTAIGTKGLEYKAVVLLNFCNDPAYKHFSKIINGTVLSSSDEFELSHFFTKLYIAVSRARKQLFVVDTDENYENFWKYFTDEETWKREIDKLGLDAERRNLVGHLTYLDDIDSFVQRLSDTYDPEENGHQAFEKAKADKSATGMKRAQSYFFEAKLENKAAECDAYMSLYESEFEQAGDKFLSLKDIKAAIGAYWQGECWQKLDENITSKELDENISSNDKELNVIRQNVAKFVLRKCRVGTFLNEIGNKHYEAFKEAINTSSDRPIWKDVFERVIGEVQKIDGSKNTQEVIDNIERLSDAVSNWYDGFTGIMANLYYARAVHTNRGLSEKDIVGYWYGKAVKKWEEVGQTDSKEYFTAKKLTSANNSEKITWMNKLNQNSDILSRFGSNENAAALTDEARGIVFACWLKKDYEKAISYPYPSDQQVRWKRLYNHDGYKFLQKVVLKDISLEKFYFLADAEANNDTPIFTDGKIPSGKQQEILRSIFSLSEEPEKGRSYWSYFTTKLKDRDGNCILKDYRCRIDVLQALSDVIKKQGDRTGKWLASCFIDMLFDKEYNFERTRKHIDLVVKFFDNGYFHKEDFRKASRRNMYLVQDCDLKEGEFETLKNNMRSFVNSYIAGKRRVSRRQDEAEVKTLLRMYEICVPYKGTNPEYDNICKKYHGYMKDAKMDSLKPWMERRVIFNGFLDDSLLKKASFAKLESQLSEKKQELDAFVDDFSKEDAAAFVAVANTTNENVSYACTLISAKLIYKFRLRRDDLRPFCYVDTFIKNWEENVDSAVKNVLADTKHVDEYAIKLLAYSWEALYGNSFAAKQYDRLAKLPRVTKVAQLTSYFKKRALRHYFYIGNKEFVAKQTEYGIAMDRRDVPSEYPEIREERKGTNSAAPSTSKPQESRTPSSVSAGRNTPPERQPKSPTPSYNPIKETLLDVARKSKARGLSIDLIMDICPGLSREEIEAL